MDDDDEDDEIKETDDVQHDALTDVPRPEYECLKETTWPMELSGSANEMTTMKLLEHQETSLSAYQESVVSETELD